MTEPRWKVAERRLAKELGGERVGILGHEDVRHERLSVEVKTRQALPRFLVRAYGQAVDNARSGKVPLLVLKEKGKRYADCLCILRLGDFLSMFKSELRGQADDQPAPEDQGLGDQNTRR